MPDVDKLWASLRDNPHSKEAASILFLAQPLYRDAIVCYKAGAFYAATIMCRAPWRQRYTPF
jgi:hypothetical protein